MIRQRLDLTSLGETFGNAGCTTAVGSIFPKFGSDSSNIWVDLLLRPCASSIQRMELGREGLHRTVCDGLEDAIQHPMVGTEVEATHHHRHSLLRSVTSSSSLPPQPPTTYFGPSTANQGKAVQDHWALIHSPNTHPSHLHRIYLKHLTLSS